MVNFSDGARGRNDAIPVNQAQSGFQPGTLTDANPPRPAGDVSNLASAVPCLGVELAITGDSTLPRFTTRAELEAGTGAYEALKRAGHSPAKAAEIMLDAKRGDNYARRWIAAVAGDCRVTLAHVDLKD